MSRIRNSVKEFILIGRDQISVFIDLCHPHRHTAVSHFYFYSLFYGCGIFQCQLNRLLQKCFLVICVCVEHCVKVFCHFFRFSIVILYLLYQGNRCLITEIIGRIFCILVFQGCGFFSALCFLYRNRRIALVLFGCLAFLHQIKGLITDRIAKLIGRCKIIRSFLHACNCRFCRCRFSFRISQRDDIAYFFLQRFVLEQCHIIVILIF